MTADRISAFTGVDDGHDAIRTAVNGQRPDESIRYRMRLHADDPSEARLLQLFNATARSGREKKAMCCMFFVIAQRFLDQMATQHRKQEHAP